MKQTLHTMMHAALLAAATGISLRAAPAARAAEPPSHFWTLGAGSYGSNAGEFDKWSGFTDLDRARADWVYHCFGSIAATPETTAMLNRLLAINPDLKILVRIWPIQGRGVFLDYLYEPGVKERVLQAASQQVHVVMDNISKPENVRGFTFLEELPDHFCNRDELDSSAPEKLPSKVEKYKQQIAAELGADFKWDWKAKQWYGRKLVETLNEIHTHIKKESGGKWVFVYFMANYDTLDWVEEDEDGSRANLLPFHWRDLIKPGVADGFFAYPNSDYAWNRYLKMAEDNDWLFFSQLSQPSGMRLSGWEDTIRRVETKAPRNLGYFLYTYGEDAIGHWNDDPSIDPSDNFAVSSLRTHFRQHLAKRGVGMDIVKQNLRPEVELQYDVGRDNPIAYIFQAVIRNTREASWFADPDEAVLRNVKVTLALPPAMRMTPKYSCPATITFDALQPGEARQVIWWPQGKGPVDVSEATPISVTVEADGVPPTVRTWTVAQSKIEPPQSFEARQSGASWYYPLPGGGPEIKSTTVTIECLRDQATLPSIQINETKAIYLGVLLKGQTLVLGPERKAVLVDKEHPDGQDVTDKLGGSAVAVKLWKLNSVVYTDMDTPSPSAKVRVSITREYK